MSRRISFRTTVPVSHVRGHVVRAWRSATPQLMGFNAVQTDVFVYLLDDGRLVGQDWYRGHEKPDLHYLKSKPSNRNHQEKLDAMSGSAWIEMDLPAAVVGGRPF